MRLVLSLSLLVSAACALGSAAGEAAKSKKARLREICRVTLDGPGPGITRVAMRDEIEFWGEEGRRSLLALVKSSDPVDVICALDYLSDFKEPRVLPTARAILDDARATTQMKVRALGAVGILKDEVSLDRAIRAFAASEREIRVAAAFALGGIGDERGLRLLRRAVTERTISPWSVVRALGVRGHEEAIEILLPLLEDPQVARYEPFRDDIVLSLAHIGGARAHTATLNTLSSYRNAEARKRTATDVAGVWFEERRETNEPAEQQEIDEALKQVLIMTEQPSS